MKREEIDDKLKWDLKKIYKTEKLWEEDYKKLENIINKIYKYKGKLYSNSNTLYEALKLEDEMEILFSKLSFYAYLNKDVNLKDSNAQKLCGLLDKYNVLLSEKTSYIMPELLSKDMNTINKFEKENEKLKEYHFMFENLFRYKDHTLSEKEERVLSMMSSSFETPSEISSVLRDNDIDFKTIKDEKGNKIKLSNNNYSLFLQSKNKRVRKDAFMTLHNTYSNYQNVLSISYNHLVVNLYNYILLKNYKSSLEYSLFNENIPETVYTNLVDTVNKNINILHKYYKYKKEKLGYKELNLYDVYVSMTNVKSKKYTLEKAKELILNTFKVFGKDYTDKLKFMFDNGYIDYMPHESKRSGAYSSTIYTQHPYVLLNYSSKYDDVSTLAHELGHAMHGLYSCENNPYVYHDTSIFIAEVASTVNELLLANYVLNNSSSKKEKMYILDKTLELIRATLFRQTMFAEFEKEIHSDNQNGEVITYDLLNSKYYELNKKYFGKDVNVNKEIEIEWARIPHFYTPFYVYKYATGICASIAIVSKIINGEKGAIENYIKFLKLGSSVYPIEALKVAGVDMEDKTVIQNAINYFDKLLNEYKILNK
jgi:oligoendopeptidase F